MLRITSLSLWLLIMASQKIQIYQSFIVSYKELNLLHPLFFSLNFFSIIYISSVVRYVLILPWPLGRFFPFDFSALIDIIHFFPYFIVGICDQNRKNIFSYKALLSKWQISPAAMQTYTTSGKTSRSILNLNIREWGFNA